DFVLLLLPVTAETRGYMNAARLSQMKPSAYLLNFGRGELVVDGGLVDAVKRRVIAGAVLDVFTTEPLPAEHPFWTTEGITVLPHIGGLHPQRDRLGAQPFVGNLRRFVEERSLPPEVERTRGYKTRAEAATAQFATAKRADRSKPPAEIALSSICRMIRVGLRWRGQSNRLHRGTDASIG